MTHRPKTGDEAFVIIKDDIKYAEDTYGVCVIGCSTDDGPDCKKMRRLLVESFVWLAAFVCWAHQASLMTGNYLSINTPYSYSVVAALNIIKFINAHKRAKELLITEQTIRLVPGTSVVKLFLPGQTRWTAQYLAGR